MTFRNARLHRGCAWLGLVAIVLLSIVPTISQLVGMHCDAQGSLGHRCEEAAHQRAAHHDGTPLHGERGDPWHKCGYCDFLTHAPALGGFELAARFAVSLPRMPVSRVAVRPIRAAYPLAAHPRGPPQSV
jgi:DUF2946 family protein